MPENSSVSMFSQTIKLKIKVIIRCGSVTSEQRGCVTINRDTITYEKLRRHLIKVFKIKPMFLMIYMSSLSEVLLPVVDDWDLDAALQQSRNALKMVVHAKQRSHDACESSYEVSSADQTADMAANSAVLIKSNQSLLDRVIFKLKDLIFKDEKLNPVERPSSVSRFKSAMTLKEFQTFLDCEGRLADPQAFRESIYRGGVTPKLRKMVWKHLLNIYPEGMTGNDRLEYLKRKSHEYTELKNAWKTQSKDAEHRLSENIKFVTTMVKKDVTRTDRTHPYFRGKEDNKHILSLYDLLCTYAINHPDVSYCQGMCDFASPLLVTQDNEAHAYILFCSLMERIKYNFSHDGKAISTKFDHLTQLLTYFDKEFYTYLQDNQVDDLLFSYRWILLEMKREFPFEDSLLFTETMWSCLPFQLRKTEIQLSHSEEGDETLCFNPLLMLSPYAKLHSLQESDTLSEYSQDDNTTSYYSDTEPLSQDQLLIAREQTLYEQLDNLGLSTDIPKDRCSSVLSDATCHCFDEILADVESRSTFYVELDDLDYFWYGKTTKLNDYEELKQCHCSKSVDSGYLSRPDSPSRPTDLLGLSQLEDSTEVSALFPPPQEFGCGNPFLLFAALTMILQHRDRIMEEKMDFNDIFMLFNCSMRRSNMKSILTDTKLLYEAYINNDFQTDDDDYEHICL